MRKLQYAELPERRSLQRQWHKVYGPRGRNRLTVWTLGGTLVAVWTHFDLSIMKVRPCAGIEECPFCLQGQSRRFMGYIPAVRHDTRELCVVEITEGAARKMLDIGILPNNLRGQELKLFRLKEHKNAPVMVEAKPIRDAHNLPEPFDVLPHLERLWGWTDAHEPDLKKRKEARPQDMKSLMSGIGEMAGQS